MRHKTLGQRIKDKWEYLRSHVNEHFLQYVTFALALMIAYSHSVLVPISGQSMVTLLIYIPLLIGFVITYTYLISPYISRQFYNKVAIVYLCYVLGAYFIRMTLNLNNESFNWLNFKEFWDLNFLPVFIFILGGSLFLKSKAGRRRRWGEKLNLDYLMTQFFVMFCLTGNVFKDRFLSNELLAVEDKIDFTYLSHLFWYDLGFYLFFLMIGFLGLKGLKDLKRNKPSLALALTMSTFLSTIFNYCVQVGITDTGAHYDAYIASGATLFQIVCFTAVSMLVYAISNRYLLGTAINVILGVGISVINAIKFELRKEPLILPDFAWVNNIVFFKEYMSFPIVISVIGAISVIGLGLFFSRRFSILVGAIYESWKQRLLCLLVVFGLFFGTSTLFRYNNDGKIAPYIPVLSSVYNLYDVNWFGINANARFQSLSFVWFRQYSETAMEMPKGYNKERIKQIYSRYRKLSEELNASRSQNITDQTVIYVLSESFTDMTRFDSVTLSGDPLPNIHRIEEETTSGLMKSDGYGGGTANMEFQSLTGLPMYNYSNMVSIMYADVVPKIAKLPSLSDAYAPKNRIAIHLANANNYSRSVVYDKLNFKTFVAAEGSKDKPDSFVLYGGYPSDRSTYQNILSKIDTDQNQFFSVMTMQNHAPMSETENMELQAEGEKFGTEGNQTLTNYVNLLKETDRSTEDFLNQLKAIDKKITVVFYGDHLPGFFPAHFFDQDPSKQYLTDYFIWSNYETPKLDYPEVNSSDFGAELLEVTNSRVSPYYALLTEVLKKNTANQGGAPVDKQIAEDLKMVQYDISAGKNYIGQHPDFFELPGSRKEGK